MSDSLEDNPFSFNTLKSGSVQFFYNGKLIKTISGKEAITFTSKADVAGDEALQLLIAKATRNFKRGNEKRY